MDQRQVSFLNFSGLKCITQLRMRNIIFSDQQEPGRLLVEPVYDARTALTTHIRQILKVKHERVCNRSSSGARPRMDDHSGRFLNDGQISIFEVNLERNLLR